LPSSFPRRGGLHGRLDLGFARDVAAMVARGRADRRRGLAACLILHVEQRNLCAARGESHRCRVAEARCAAADDRLDPIEIHAFPRADSLQP
jgi:hypothetical protein